MDYLSHNVSENLKRIRQSKGMSLDQVAEQTGVSKSMLAQIEKGTANPSIGVLGKITSGLRIEFQRLIDPPRVDYALISPDDLVPTKELLGQYRVWTCFPYEDSREVEVYRIDVEPGGVYTSGGHEIHRGQVYKFETDQPHLYRNDGDRVASCMCFFLDYTNIR